MNNRHRQLLGSLFLLLLSGSLAAWTSEDIRSLQERLRENQFYSGPLTGALDRDTEIALAKATADFPEISRLKGDRKEYFVAQILSWYNNAYELRAADSRSSSYLRVKTIQLPTGRFRLSFREDGDFKHIEHVYELIVSFGRRLEISEEFINHSNPNVWAKASIYGNYRIGRWTSRHQDTVFFYVTAKSGDVWTARDFMELALRAGLKRLPVSFSVEVIGEDVIAVNGDRFERVKAS